MPATLEILCIGDELLIGRTVNTNATWLGNALTEAGAYVSHSVTLADRVTDIHQALQLALSRADVVITTGGLGPTGDDYTVAALAQYAGMPLELHAPTLAHIDQLLRARGRQPNEYSRKMALLPKGATVLPNPAGAAPGLLMHIADKPVIILPGVPHEMKALMQDHVLPWLHRHYALDKVQYHTWHLVAAESELAALLAAQEAGLPEACSLAYNPGLGILDLRLGMRIPAPDAGKQVRFEQIRAEISRIVAPWCYGENGVSLAMALGQALRTQGLQLAVAESCTAGLLANTIAEVSGASAWYVGGALTYSNVLKTQLLGVPPVLFETAGAVSEEVALAMAAGVAGLTGAQVALSTTGIAGPEGGTPDKPVGTVWIGVHTPAGTVARRFLFEKDRRRNMQRAVHAALWMACKALRTADQSS
ncbi:MAG: CinA family nicotinamide mononucleotide deamidase-related protein [Bacteroidetes bacterium]|nr:CinA family nicotinamide mononucleotide deamidase-related protein [Bacteroidota bacterium]